MDDMELAKIYNPTATHTNPKHIEMLRRVYEAGKADATRDLVMRKLEEWDNEEDDRFEPTETP